MTNINKLIKSDAFEKASKNVAVKYIIPMINVLNGYKKPSKQLIKTVLASIEQILTDEYDL